MVKCQQAHRGLAAVVCSITRKVIVNWLMCGRCHLASGKMVWLCAEHQKHDGITVLSDEVADTAIISQDAGVDVNSAFQDFTSDANQRQKGSDATKRPSTAKGSPILFC